MERRRSRGERSSCGLLVIATASGLATEGTVDEGSGRIEGHARRMRFVEAA